MIIDSHIHMMDAIGMLTGASPEALRDELQKRGIEKAWAFTLSGFYKDCAGENDALKRVCSACPDVYIPFMTVNPRDGAAAIDEMERAYYELNMKGLKVHPWCQSFSLTEKWFHEMCKKCVQLSIPLVLHDGTPPYSETLQACYIAEQYPKLTVILGHAGLNDLWKEALYGAKRLPNVYLGTCSTPYFAVETMIRELGSHRVLYGSDGGFGNAGIIDNNLNKIYQLELSPEALNNVLCENARRLLH